MLGSKYAVINPKPGIYAPYFKIAIERAMPEFLAKNKTTINIQIDSFENFEIDIHEEMADQMFVANALQPADMAICKEKEVVDKLKDIKKIALKKMLI